MILFQLCRLSLNKCKFRPLPQLLHFFTESFTFTYHLQYDCIKRYLSPIIIIILVTQDATDTHNQFPSQYLISLQIKFIKSPFNLVPIILIPPVLLPLISLHLKLTLKSSFVHLPSSNRTSLLDTFFSAAKATYFLYNAPNGLMSYYPFKTVRKYYF